MILVLIIKILLELLVLLLHIPLKQEKISTSISGRLLDGYTDPEGHYLFIENLTADSNGYITTIYEGEWILSSHNSNFEGDIVLSYTVADEFGGSVDGTTTVTFKPPSYTTIESQGNITLVRDDDTYGYAQDAQGNKTAITYFDEHISNNMWEGWTYLAAENINGVNSVIWRYDDPYGFDSSFWLTFYDENWAYTDSGDAGYPGDPRFGQAPDMQFYKTETNFNIDLNKDGDIGFDNKDPVRTSGSPLTYTVKTGEDIYFNQWDLLDGYTDPEGHYLFIENLTADSNGYITTIYEGEWILSSHNSNFEGDIVLSYTVADEFGGSVDGKTTVTFKPPSYTTIESKGNITLVRDDDYYGYAQDAQGNKTAITYFDEHIRNNMWEGWTS